MCYRCFRYTDCFLLNGTIPSRILLVFSVIWDFTTMCLNDIFCHIRHHHHVSYWCFLSCGLQHHLFNWFFFLFNGTSPWCVLLIFSVIWDFTIMCFIDIFCHMGFYHHVSYWSFLLYGTSSSCVLIRVPTKSQKKVPWYFHDFSRPKSKFPDKKYQYLFFAAHVSVCRINYRQTQTHTHTQTHTWFDQSQPTIQRILLVIELN